MKLAGIVGARNPQIQLKTTLKATQVLKTGPKVPIQNSNMIQIKKTKSVEMSGDIEGVTLDMVKSGQAVWIPVSVVFQVKRGLESYIQRFYRKHIK